MVRFGCTAILVVVALALAGTARADADPASDALYTGRVFLPFDTKIAPALVESLAAATRAAEQAGRPVRVALIASPNDLGGIPTLFGKPTDYARFLGLELQFVYLGQVLVVMPQGAALSKGGRLVANGAVVHAVIGAGGDGLARAAIDIVRSLAGLETKTAQASPAPAGGSTSKGTSIWIVAAISIGVVCVLVAAGIALGRRRRRVPG